MIINWELVGLVLSIIFGLVGVIWVIIGSGSIVSSPNMRNAMPNAGHVRKIFEIAGRTGDGRKCLACHWRQSAGYSYRLVLLLVWWQTG